MYLRELAIFLFFRSFSRHGIGTENLQTLFVPCPAGVDIPRNLAIANQLKAITHPFDKLTVRNNYVTIPLAEQATSCVTCGICQTRCPQQIDIPKHLKELTEGLEGWEKALPLPPTVETTNH